MCICEALEKERSAQMIKNAKQYLAAKSQAENLRRTLDLSRKHPVEMPQPVFEAMIAGIESQINDIEQEISDYEKLQETKRVPIASFDDMGRLLIQARITCGYSQRQLAEKAGLKEQVIQRYESTEYRCANLERLKLIMLALGYSAIIEMANKKNRLVDLGAPGICDIQSTSTDATDTDVSFHSEWSKMGRLQKKTDWTIHLAEAA